MEKEQIGYVDTANNKVVYPFLKKQFALKPEEEIRLLLVQKLILEYDYAPTQIAIELSIKSGRGVLPKRADIVVFGDEKNKRPEENAYIIVEVKKKDRKDGLDQLETYINNTTAEFGIWFNGSEAAVYLQRLRKPHKFREIPDVPKAGETLKEIGLYRKDQLKPATELKSVFENCHNYIFANEGLLKEKVFNEVLKLIFIKMVDEKSADPRCQFRITETELDLLEAGKNSTFMPRIQRLFDRVKREYRDVFDKEERILLKPLTIAYVVSQLQKFSLINTPADVKGIAFQTFVYAHQRGERGEFFTPYPILDLVVNMLQPKDDELIVDPACGSGGFLVEAMKYVWRELDRQRSDLSEANRRDMKIRHARNYIQGIDINPDLARVAKMHMILFDDGHTGVFSADALQPLTELNHAAMRAGSRDIKMGSVDIVLTNPPFGSKGRITSKAILQEYQLGHRWTENGGVLHPTNHLLRAQIPDILFIERCLQLLAPGGRMAIVLPDSDLNNMTYKSVIEYIKRHSRILAVISLPFGTFKHAGPNTKASVLFLQKSRGPRRRTIDYKIFMAAADSIGFDLRSKNPRLLYKRDESGDLLLNKDGKPIVDSDIPTIVSAFLRFKKEQGIKF